MGLGDWGIERMTFSYLRSSAFICGLLLLPTARAVAQTAEQQLTRDIFQQLIEINTTHEHGSTASAAEAMAVRLRDAGFPVEDVQVLGPADSKNPNLVVRYRGSGGRPPILFLAHLDVVEARAEDWSVDPFVLTEREGWFYGRGTSDIKDGDAILVTSFIRLKREGFVPDRDLIVMLTAGEESGGDYNGVSWLLQTHRELIDAPFAVNLDAGAPERRNGQRTLQAVQAAEKVSVTFRLEVKNPGGHSSLPVKENAIYRLARGLTRLAQYDFPVGLSEITRGYFRAMAALSVGERARALSRVAAGSAETKAVAQLSSDPFYNAQLRTTCVATMLDGGHAINALPQTAGATVNCRMLPGDSAPGVLAALRRALTDSQIAITQITQPLPSPPSPLTPEILEPAKQVTAELWPGLPLVPIMMTGATDGRYLRNAGIPTYGISGVFLDVDDIRAHGRDERIGVQDFYDGAEYNYRLMRRLATP
jgi:acetylornithine deacetylase/succinyl-diaminopimelate desuccinylase-like protein